MHMYIHIHIFHTYLVSYSVCLFLYLCVSLLVSLLVSLFVCLLASYMFIIRCTFIVRSIIIVIVSCQVWARIARSAPESGQYTN